MLQAWPDHYKTLKTHLKNILTWDSFCEFDAFRVDVFFCSLVLFRSLAAVNESWTRGANKCFFSEFKEEYKNK